MEQACAINIGPRERRKRFTGGVVFLGVAVALAACELATGATRPWRLLLFVPLWVSAVGFFQARDKT
ncbi:MAG TPA: hypothetical protein VMB50_13905 [Myxococcales bacterium]|nr:hypothetical protein [Myxococcales bacterium]